MHHQLPKQKPLRIRQLRFPRAFRMIVCLYVLQHRCRLCRFWSGYSLSMFHTYMHAQSLSDFNWDQSITHSLFRPLSLVFCYFKVSLALRAGRRLHISILPLCNCGRTEKLSVILTIGCDLTHVNAEPDRPISSLSLIVHSIHVYYAQRARPTFKRRVSEREKESSQCTHTCTTLDVLCTLLLLLLFLSSTAERVYSRSIGSANIKLFVWTRQRNERRDSIQFVFRSSVMRTIANKLVVERCTRIIYFVSIFSILSHCEYNIKLIIENTYQSIAVHLSFTCQMNIWSLIFRSRFDLSVRFSCIIVKIQFEISPSHSSGGKRTELSQEHSCELCKTHYRHKISYNNHIINNNIASVCVLAVCRCQQTGEEHMCEKHFQHRREEHCIREITCVSVATEAHTTKACQSE